MHSYPCFLTPSFIHLQEQQPFSDGCASPGSMALRETGSINRSLFTLGQVRGAFVTATVHVRLSIIIYHTYLII